MTPSFPIAIPGPWVDTAWVPPDDTRYARAVGRVRVRERELLAARRLRTLAEARGLEAAFLELEDTVYGPELGSLTHPEDFEIALRREVERTYAVFSELCLEPMVDQWLRLAHDTSNIKAWLKGGSESSMSAVGSVPWETCRDAMESGDYRDLPRHVAVLAEGAARLTHDDGLLAAELWLDREVHANRARLAAGRRNAFLEDLTAAKSDLANMVTVVRLNRLGKPRAEAVGYIAPGGSLGAGFWLKLCGMPLQETQEALSVSDYGVVAALGIEQVAESGSFALLEKLSEEYIMRLLRRARALVFGIEPLVAYVLAKEHEVAMVRMVLVGKRNDIPSDLLVDRVSLCYV